MFQVVARHWELVLSAPWHFQNIFDFWTSKKCDLCEVKKETFLMVAKQCELIFCSLTSPKCELDEVKKEVF